MKVEILILIIAISIAALSLWMFIPKNKILDAHISFMFMQIQTWIYGALVVENRLIEYPVRLMDYAYRISLSFEYFIFPAISALFNIHFPNGKSLLYKVLYIAMYPSLITIIEVILEKNTDIIRYLHWTWYLSWITMIITLLISHWYYCWFMEKIKHRFGK